MQNEDNYYEYQTELPPGSLTVIYGQNQVEDLSGILKNRYASKEPSPWRYIFGVYIGGNYTIEFRLSRASALRLWKRLGEWLKIEPQRGDYTDFEMIPGGT